ncbi:hypothetical protein [Fictibacillus sp. 26RED30]|jgi:hypothetical protein|uniref:hypothetical protein n=1 Tax=Fictibacillus sp. 26RED30 TaxID=2745877 RepID=UPI0018CEE995|nr:hypothetical protein [Fictibacillus sp. 26RED30]MBH0163201.1 hypothetical protein [Fictibacillus sp. 26RED30]
MKKSLLKLILITLSILFAGCSVYSESKETAPNLIKQDKKEALIITGDVNKTFKNNKAVRIARDAIQSAERIPGILNVSRNDLEMTLVDSNGNKESYLLWLRKDRDSGMIMYADDTSTGYTLQRVDVVKLKKLLNF